MRPAPAVRCQLLQQPLISSSRIHGTRVRVRRTRPPIPYRRDTAIALRTTAGAASRSSARTAQRSVAIPARAATWLPWHSPFRNPVLRLSSQGRVLVPGQGADRHRPPAAAPRASGDLAEAGDLGHTGFRLPCARPVCRAYDQRPQVQTGFTLEARETIGLKLIVSCVRATRPSLWPVDLRQVNSGAAFGATLDRGPEATGSDRRAWEHRTRDYGLGSGSEVEKRGGTEDRIRLKAHNHELHWRARSSKPSSALRQRRRPVPLPTEEERVLRHPLTA